MERGRRQPLRRGRQNVGHDGDKVGATAVDPEWLQVLLPALMQRVAHAPLRRAASPRAAQPVHESAASVPAHASPETPPCLAALDS